MSSYYNTVYALTTYTVSHWGQICSNNFEDIITFTMHMTAWRSPLKNYYYYCIHLTTFFSGQPG